MTLDYLIRPARPDDADAISAMMQESYGTLLVPDYNPKILSKALPRISKARPELLICGTYYVAEDPAGVIIGAGGWTDLSPARGLARDGEGHMRHVAVRPAMLRCGIGRALADASFASAQEFGMRALRCMSTLTAQPFYERLGFEPEQPVELTLEPGLFFPAIEMRKVL